MSKISLAPNAAGTAIFTIESPGTSTNRTLTLPDDTGTIVTNSGNQAGSFTTLNTSGAVVFNDAGADVDFRVESDTVDHALFVEGSSGNVGIGTSSPVGELNVNGRIVVDDGARANPTGGPSVVIDYQTTANIEGRIRSRDWDGAAWKNFTIDANNILFNGGGSERARITSGGVLLVGATSQVINESCLGLSSSGNTMTSKTSAGVGGWPLLTWNSATSGDNKFIEFLTETVSTQRGSIDYNRGAGLTRYNTASDATLKNIIGDSDGQKSVEILNSTRIREFAWKDDETQKPQIGVIAQELYETFKGAVSVGGDYEATVPAVIEQRLVSEAVLDEDGNEIEAAVYETVEVEPERTETKYRPWGVDKTAFTFHLVAGWQAHEKIIKQQADMIAALEARITALEAGNV